MHKQLTPDEIIDALGGTLEVATLCEITDGAVSQWRKNGIPKAQLKFLRAVKPKVFAALEGVAQPARRADDPPPGPDPGAEEPPSRKNLLECRVAKPPLYERAQPPARKP